MRTSNTRRQASQPEYHLEARLDALVCGDCTEDEFVDEALERYNSKSSAYLIARIDQYYQRGQLPDPLYRAIKSKITQRVLARAIDQADDVVTPSPADGAAPTVGGRTFVAEPPSAQEEAETTSPAAAASETPLPFGHVVRHRYTVLSRLGRGETADVYKVTDECRAWLAEADRLIALKILREPQAHRPERREALRQEFDRLRRLTHPNILKVYDFDQDDAMALYTMEGLAGERLSDLIARAQGKALPRAYAWAIIRAVGAALAHAHARGVIHGDVSARNVLIGAGGELRLLGFGAAAPSRAGTPAYASCELLEGAPADARDDLYSLACLACELLGGAHPFLGRRATEARLRGMAAQRPRGIDFSTWRTLRRGLAWSRGQRPESIRQWLAALGIEPEPARLPPIDQNMQRKPVMRVQHVAFAAALVASALLGYFFVWHSIDRITDHSAPAVADAASSAPAAAPVADPKATSPEVPISAADADDAQEAAPPAPRVKAAAPAPPARPTLKFAAKRIAVAPGTTFAEIHVFRSRPAPDLNDFMWWTEDSSAHSGVDFVAQDRTTHPFAHGAHTATIFVKILPRADRSHSASFKVCAGKASGDAANDVTCSAVVLPARG